MNNLVLVTGASGLIGSRLTELLQDKHEFIFLSYGQGFDITDSLKSERALQRVCGGLSRSDRKPKALIHLAGFTDVNAAHQQNGNRQGSCYQINVIGTQNIVNLCRENNLRLIHISTDFVFNGKKTTPYTEEDQPSPVEWYGYTKHLGEQAVQESDLDWNIIRPSFPFRQPFPDKKDLVQKIISKLKAKKEINQFIDHFITPTFVDDLAPAFDALLQSNKVKEIFHFVGSSPVSDYELAQAVAKTFDLDASLIKKSQLDDYHKITDRPYQRSLKMSNAKAQKILGVKFHSLESALKILKEQEVNE